MQSVKFVSQARPGVFFRPMTLPKSELTPRTEEELHKEIDANVKKDKVVLYMKGVPAMPQCGFSRTVVQILEYYGVDFKGYNALESDELRGAIKTYSNWPTLPQLFVNGELVGGRDILYEMFQKGELENFFKEQGVPIVVPKEDA